MKLFHENPIFETVKSKVIISLFETVRLSVSISPRNLYNPLKSIKEIIIENFLNLFSIWKFFLSNWEKIRVFCIWTGAHNWPLRNTEKIPAIIRVLPFLSNPKDLDLSYQMDLDFLDCFGRKKTPSYNLRNMVPI